jgi:hypothetical protein
MFNHPYSVRRTFIAMAVPLVSTFAGELVAQENCREFRGNLAPEAVSEGCASPVGICATGRFTGILSQLNFVATAVTQTDLSPDTGVIVITGNSVTDTRGLGGEPGTIMHTDTIVLNTGSTNEFSEVDIIVGGSGPFEGATGVMQISGTFPPTGAGQATYQATVCTPTRILP